MTTTAHLVAEIRKLKAELLDARNNNLELKEELQRCNSRFDRFIQTCKEAVPMTIEAWNHIILSFKD